ncbi:uncharacterized protein LOC125941240 [Dermacentor silvarum]|uniref:uncharacterized protein LOC125941240 n=1 Tax=Dermacentor silvarum TaxID=543639 RepID=UPI00210101B7|nr:uncharacterized protein LOC125941240 [Dermacentor silvarum]
MATTEAAPENQRRAQAEDKKTMKEEWKGKRDTAGLLQTTRVTDSTPFPPPLLVYPDSKPSTMQRERENGRGEMTATRRSCCHLECLLREGSDAKGAEVSSRERQRTFFRETVGRRRRRQCRQQTQEEASARLRHHINATPHLEDHFNPRTRQFWVQRYRSLKRISAEKCVTSERLD